MLAEKYSTRRTLLFGMLSYDIIQKQLKITTDRHKESFTGRVLPPLFSGSEGSAHKSSGARTQKQQPAELVSTALHDRRTSA